ncbi:hypothetical protein O4H52_04650 [Sphingomonadaceae bacterium G21617-S1]|uniref:hypothetical protein n=1 Tax=Rhizorhabdus sp. TaxID=1968843 RepID=UPI0019998B51|nr:hypothetical protein [Rhizorhabdus sp.]MBD3761959.1 hypothetical protein [Rhizorhabdus sp.]MCZ4340881.1 hypothetical protein [Sphingomonadaceae bacterium G21617-S1]
MMGDDIGERPRGLGIAAALALAIVVTALATATLLEGPSLDDYWTVYLADPARSLDALINERWIQDIRPPLFDGWATLLSRIGLTSIPIARLVSNLPAIVLLVYAARCFGRRLPEHGSFHTIFLLLMLSTPATAQAFGVYRGDFWQLASFAIQVMLTRHIMYVQKDYRSRDDGLLALLALPATFFAITLDYGGALFGGVLAMVTILAAIARGLKRWTRWLAIVTMAAVATVIYTISWQNSAWIGSFDLYQNWIEMGNGSTFSVVFALLFGTILHNPIAVAGAWLGRQRWTRGDTGFAVLIAAALAASLMAVTQIDAQRRLVTSSNTADIAVLVVALMATAGTMIADRRLWMNALTAIAALSTIVAVTAHSLGGAWQTAAKQIARIALECPGTPVYAASGWRLDDGSKSRAARREEPVFTLGYKRLGTTHGFNPVILHPDKPLAATPGRCPVLIWIEQVPPMKRIKTEKLFQQVGITGLDRAKISLTRTKSGLIVRADR